MLPVALRSSSAAPEISNCNGCEREFAIKAGADWAAWGTVQKVSNLILNINVYIEDARQKKMEFVKSVDIAAILTSLGNAASTTCFVTICSATLMITRLSSATPKLCRGFVAMTQTRD